MKSTSVISSLALVLAMAAAPLAAKDVKPVATTSTQGGAVALGTLTPAAVGVIVVVGAAAVAALGGGSGSDAGSTTSTPSTTD